MLRLRVITALVLLGGLLVAVFMLPQAAWWAFVAVVAGAAGWEWAGLARLDAMARYAYGSSVALTVGVLAALAHPLVDLVVLAVSAMFWLCIVPAWLKNRWAAGTGLGALMLGLLVLVPALLAMARLRDPSPWLLLAVAAVVWVADIAAYFGGRAFGKNKLAPEISPGKSWEGVWCGVAGVFVYGTAAGLTVLPQPVERFGWLVFFGLLGVLAALSVMGDLFESLLKRQSGVKDSSGLLPGHGGLLDRIDSLTSTLPLAALWLVLWSA